MPKFGLRVLVVAAVISLAAPIGAQAGNGTRGGAIGGMQMGAVIGAPVGGPFYPGFAPLVGYEPFSFNAPFPVNCPGGYWAHRPYVSRWGHVWGYSDPRFVCP
jgi:hypothetical protein